MSMCASGVSNFAAIACRTRCTKPLSSLGSSTRYNKYAPLPESTNVGAGQPSEPRNASKRFTSSSTAFFSAFVAHVSFGRTGSMSKSSHARRNTSALRACRPGLPCSSLPWKAGSSPRRRPALRLSSIKAHSAIFAKSSKTPPKVLRALVMARSSWRSPGGKKKRRPSRISATRSAFRCCRACFARLVAVVCFGSAVFPFTVSETGSAAAASCCRNAAFFSSLIALPFAAWKSSRPPQQPGKARAGKGGGSGYYVGVARWRRATVCFPTSTTTHAVRSP